MIETTDEFSLVLEPRKKSTASVARLAVAWRTLVGLTTAIHCAVRCARTEIARLLQTFEIVNDGTGNGRTVRSGYVFNKDNFTSLILRNSPGPGVRNDGSNNPGKTLAPIEVAGDKFEDALLHQGVDFIKRLHHGCVISSYAVFLSIRSKNLLARWADAEIG